MPYILAEHFERPNVTINVDMVKKGFEPKTFTAGKGATTTSASALASTSEPVRTSIIPSHPIVLI